MHLLSVWKSVAGFFVGVHEGIGSEMAACHYFRIVQLLNE